MQCERQKEKTLKIPSPTRGRDSFRGFSPPQGQNKKAITFVIERAETNRFADALRITQDKLDSKNFYACNPSFDKGCGKIKNC